MTELLHTRFVSLHPKGLTFQLVSTLGWVRIYIHRGTEQELIGASTITLLKERIGGWLQGGEIAESPSVHCGIAFVPLLILSERHCYLGGTPDRSALLVFDGDSVKVPLIARLDLSEKNKIEIISVFNEMVNILRS